MPILFLPSENGIMAVRPMLRVIGCLPLRGCPGVRFGGRRKDPRRYAVYHYQSE
jgi:hypothetical protein